jgi:hypothetical protein
MSHQIMVNLGQSPNQATWGWVKVTKTCTIWCVKAYGDWNNIQSHTQSTQTYFGHCLMTSGWTMALDNKLT